MLLNAEKYLPSIVIQPLNTTAVNVKVNPPIDVDPNTVLFYELGYWIDGQRDIVAGIVTFTFNESTQMELTVNDLARNTYYAFATRAVYQKDNIRGSFGEAQRQRPGRRLI